MKSALVVPLVMLLAGCTYGSVVDGAEEETPVLPLALRHEFRGPPEQVPFTIAVETEARIETWFDGTFVNEDALAIRLLAPDGRVHAATTTPPSFSGGDEGVRTFHAGRDVVLTPGTWTVSFEGSGRPFGVAVLQER